MSTCFDVYVLPSGCDTIWTYPSAVHPPAPTPISPGGAAGPVLGTTRRFTQYRDTEEDILAVLGLL